MKILFVATVDIHIINHHLRIIKKLKELGHSVDVASLGDYMNDDINNKMNVCFSKNPLSINNLSAYFKIKRILRENQYDVISCHTPISSFFTRLATRKCKSKVIYTAHGFHFFKGAPLINQVMYKNMERFASRYTDILVAINEEDYLEAKKFKLKRNGYVVQIPGVGIDINRQLESMRKFKLTRGDLNLKGDDYVICSVGELNDNKNHMFIFEALNDFMRTHANIHYVICGRGPLSDKYEEYLKEHGLASQIHLLGYREDIYQILSLSDIFVFPSLREGLPVSIMEAMVAHIPVLASKVRGNIDLIDNEVNGLLFESGDSVGFKEKFIRMYKNDELCAQFIKYNDFKINGYDVNLVDEMILSLYK